MSAKTPRLGLQYPLDTDYATPPSDFSNLANALDNISVVFYQQDSSSTPSAPKGSVWYQTDTHRVYYYTGIGTIGENGWILLAGSLTGQIIDYAGNLTYTSGSPLTTPAGYFVCDGAAVSKTDYAPLYNALKGSASTSPWGEATSTFNLPDLRGRTAIGTGTGTYTGATAHPLAQASGTETVTLTTSQMPQHTHTTNHNFYVAEGSSFTVATGGLFAITSVSNPITSSAGSGAAHSNMQPSAAVYKLIKY